MLENKAFSYAAASLIKQRKIAGVSRQEWLIDFSTYF